MWERERSPIASRTLYVTRRPSKMLAPTRCPKYYPQLDLLCGSKCIQKAQPRSTASFAVSHSERTDRRHSRNDDLHFSASDKWEGCPDPPLQRQRVLSPRTVVNAVGPGQWRSVKSRKVTPEMAVSPKLGTARHTSRPAHLINSYQNDQNDLVNRWNAIGSGRASAVRYSNVLQNNAASTSKGRVPSLRSLRQAKRLGISHCSEDMHATLSVSWSN